MAKVDVEWPSEDEDFDATTSDVGSSKSSKTATAERPVAVDVVSAEEMAPEAEVPEVETPAEVAPEAVEEPEVPAEPEAEAEPEAPAAEAPAEPAADPMPAAADQPPTKMKAATMPNTSAPKKTNGMIRMAGEALLLIAVIALALFAWNLSASNKNLKTQVASLNANPQVAVQKQTSALIAQVSKLINLPSGETPTIAAVTDAAQAKKQSAFFNSAENGDKVLMYVKAGEAILYRPTTNKIILVAPLTFTSNGSTAATPAATPTPTKK